MNEYKISYNYPEGATETVYIIERTQAAAVRQLLKRYGKDVEVSDTELVGTNAQATKEQERETLEKIKAMVAELGPQSYLATALDGVFEDAEQNIEYDAAFSMKARVESAEGKVKDLEDQVTEGKQRIAQLERALANEEAKARSTNAGVEELLQKDEERKAAIIRMEAELAEARTSAGDAQRRAEEAEGQVVQLKAKLYDFMTAQQ